jgi:hypothetical protein
MPENMEEIEKAGMQRVVVNCGAAAGKRVTCNPTNDTRSESRCTAK